MTVVVIILSVLAVLATLFLFLICPARRRHPDRQLLEGAHIAHRGLHSQSPNTPENSLAAFRLAAEQGFPIEMDIHLTADGEVVVFHDDDLRRMCNAQGTPETLTLEQLKTYRLNGTEESIPTLRECLDVVAGRVPLLIEFKCSFSNCGQLCAAADGILRSYTGGYVIQSFYPPVLHWYRRHHPEVCRGQLSSAFRGESLVKQLLGCLVFNVLGRPDFISYDHRYAGHPAFRLNTRLGALPVCWTFTSQEDIDSCATRCRTYIFEQFMPIHK